MDDKEILTPRQIEILRYIIKEYIDTGEPVGSEVLDKKYNLGVSPATVRNEMTVLAKKGYLKKEHFSSGRIPTSAAFRFYIKNLMKERELSTTEEVAYKNDLWDSRNEIHRLLQQATKILAKRTNLLALTSTNLGDFYYYGVPNLFNQREFWNIDLSRDFFSLFDEDDFWQDLMRQFQRIEEEVLMFLGDDEPFKEKVIEPCASIFSRFETDNVSGYVGVMGSKRIDYSTVIPRVKYIAQLIEEILQTQIKKI